MLHPFWENYKSEFWVFLLWTTVIYFPYMPASLASHFLLPFLSAFCPLPGLHSNGWLSPLTSAFSSRLTTCGSPASLQDHSSQWVLFYSHKVLSLFLSHCSVSCDWSWSLSQIQCSALPTIIQCTIAKACSHFQFPANDFPIIHRPGEILPLLMLWDSHLAHLSWSSYTQVHIQNNSISSFQLTLIEHPQ